MKYSVIIPSYNAAATLEPLLNSLKKQTLSDYEVIVVDDASTDDTENLVARYPVKYERLQRNAGPAIARNRGAELAKGEWFVFTDADTVFEPDTMQTIDEILEGSDAAALCGSYSGNPANSGFMPRYKALWEQYAIDMTFQTDERDLYVTNSWFPRPGVVSRAAYQAVGGFNARFRGADLEDMEFGYRLYEAGYRIYFTPHVHIKHHYPESFIDEQSRFLRRCVVWIRMAARRKKLDMAGDGSPKLVKKHLCGFISFCLAVCSVFYHPLIALALIGLALHTFLHRRFLALAFREEGFRFAALSFATYWIHTVFAGIAGAYGLVTYLLGKR
ncbi:MAG: glycosyltransferase [Deltaproteobacteria bacterium]|nr:glycosyltransferase [Deltaproteobacteria bacterium]